ncbi:MAG: proprotein convertase P-domain-containing protein [Thermoanaerobaculia bacterium]|nr:proprotein convertase P-domain-containing protein [Thermoanaerobaculia bacterium]
MKQRLLSSLATGVLLLGAAPSWSAPPNCLASTGSFASTTPILLADAGTTNSPLAVAGLSPYLYTARVSVNIRHSAGADLDVTLISPAGTRVALTTDNGGVLDDVFAGTTWADSALVPTTDATYVNLVPQPLLVPEEALGALVGETPNGTWTLEIVDDTAGNIGDLLSWSLEIDALPSAPDEVTSTFSNTEALPVPDVATVTSTITTSGLGTSLCGLVVTTDLRSTFSANLDVTLTSPTGATTVLTTDNGAGNDDVFAGTEWRDDAGTPVTDFAYVNLVTATPLVPEGALGHFQDSDPNGTWTLSVTNDLAGDSASLNGWSLALTTCSCVAPEADVALTKTVAPLEVAPGSPAVFTLTATNGGPAPATNVVVTDTLPAGLAYVSNDCGASFAAPTVTWTLPSLANGASAVCHVTVMVNASATNSATISSDQNDPVPANNASATTVLGDVNALEIPTAGTWGLLILGLGLGLAAWTVLRRRG